MNLSHCKCNPGNTKYITRIRIWGHFIYKAHGIRYSNAPHAVLKEGAIVLEQNCGVKRLDIVHRSSTSYKSALKNTGFHLVFG